MRKLGAIGDKQTENELLLLERDVPHLPFSAAVLKDLPVMPWSITDEVRNTCACAFDGRSKLYAGIIVTFTRPELKYFTGSLTFFLFVHMNLIN